MSRRKKRTKERSPLPTVTAPSSLVNVWERYWFGSVAAIRPYLLVKAVLLLLAFDMWMLRVDNGPRYGLDGFNVAHFDWLDAVQTIPTPPLYVGLVLSVGILALVCVFTGAGRWALALLALMYTYSWAMSMVDGFQHHYFISLVLTAFIFFPRLSARELYPADGTIAAEVRPEANASNMGKRRVSSWGYVLLGANVAVLYVFTALTKISEREFLEGKIVRRITRKKQYLAPIEVLLADFDLSPEVLWKLLALSVITIEIYLFVAYLLATRVDENRSWWLRTVAWLGFIGAVSFNGIGNELVAALRIGWFSYYMIALACIYFLPESFLWALGSLVTWPVRRLAGIGSKLSAALDRRNAKLTIGLTLTGASTMAVFVGTVGFALDLPGAEMVGLLAAFGLAGAVLLALFLGRQGEAIRYVFATGLAALLMWTAITQSTVRFVYYRRVAHYQRIRDVEASIAAYEKAIRYGKQHGSDT